MAELGAQARLVEAVWWTTSGKPARSGLLGPAHQRGLVAQLSAAELTGWREGAKVKCGNALHGQVNLLCGICPDP